MNNFFRTIIAGYGAKKLGGGCFSTILIFIIIYFALGQCNRQSVGKVLKPKGSVTSSITYVTPIKRN
ncbi:MAG: hypothetical protein WBP45_04295 [Daejeonella sp.]